MSTTVTSSDSANPPSLPEFFDRYQPVISAALQSELALFDTGLYTTHRYYMGWTDEDGGWAKGAEGKRLRPTLTLLGADLLDGDLNQALPIATSLEYVHNFSLIHDDLEDHDRFRHHRSTIWVIWGEATAIVSGNAMLSVADLATQRLVERGVSTSKAVEIQRTITEASLRMMEGQFLDLAYESKPTITIQEYLGMIDRKTGALIEASLHLGAKVAQRDAFDGRIAEGLRSIGFELGRIFQIRDDILGVWGGDDTGKPVGADLRRRKKALPAVHVLNVAKGSARKRIETLFKQTEVDDAGVQDLLQIMDDSRTREYCEGVSRAHHAEVSRAIAETELAPWAKRDLMELGSYLVKRQS